MIPIFARNPKIRLRASAASVEDSLEDNFTKLCNINSLKSWSLSFQSSWRDLYNTGKREYEGRVFPDKSPRCVRITPSMPFCPLVFQGLNEQQKEFIEKQWAQQKEQFMGRQKSMYNFAFEALKSEPRVFKVLPVFLEAPRYTRV